MKDKIGSFGHLRFKERRGGEWVTVYETHNLETDYVLNAIALSLMGASGQINGSTVSISPLSMAVGNGTTPVTSSQTGLDSELLRKTFTAPGSSKGQAGTTVTFAITLGTNEIVGQIGCLGLFSADATSGSAATGTLTIGGTPGSGDVITVIIDGRSLSPYYLPSALSTSQVATALAAAMNADGYFASLYTATAASNVVTITSHGKGTVYNKSTATQVSGGVTCTASSTISGGTTPGGQLLAAANASYVKEANREVLIEWSINVTN